jgi:hypothetical protein
MITFMMKNLSGLRRLSIVGCLSLMLAGCSLSNPTNNFFTAKANGNGEPAVWDCTVVQMASPPRYACSDNKTYTAFQLYGYRVGTDTVVK